MVDFSRDSSTHIATKTVVRFEYKDFASDVDFPSEWFSKSNHAKPAAQILKCKVSEEELDRSVKGGIKSASLTMDTVKCFLYSYGASMKDRLDERWESFKCVIGENTSEVTPWDIVSVVRTGEHVPKEPVVAVYSESRGGTIDPNTWSRRAVALYVLGIYRLIKISNEDYASSLEKRLCDVLTAEGGKGMSYHGTRQIYSSWLSDRVFLKLVAAYDMFLNRFPDHPDAILRMGTLSSRFRDCAGLISVGYAMTILNINAGEFMDWIFVRTMADEMMRMSREGQESGSRYSYFPYQADLGLVSKSPYSSNSNPYLFTWIHIIGSLIGHKRSLNARFNFEGSFADIGMNATLVTWVFARGGALDPQFNKDGVDYGADVDAAPEDDQGAEESAQLDQIWIKTQGRDPGTWFAILKSSGYKFPRCVVKAVDRQRAKIKGEREDSVGEYVKEKLIY